MGIDMRPQETESNVEGSPGTDAPSAIPNTIAMKTQSVVSLAESDSRCLSDIASFVHETRHDKHCVRGHWAAFGAFAPRQAFIRIQDLSPPKGNP